MTSLANRGMAVLVACALLGVAGCGGGGDRIVFPPKVVTAADLARYPPGSPERAVLGMSRAFQFNAPTAAKGYFAPAWHQRAALLAPALQVLAPLTAKMGPPKILAVRRHGNVAIVNFVWGGLRLELRFGRIGGRWLLLPLGKAT